MRAMGNLRLILASSLLAAMFGQEFPSTSHPGEGSSKPESLLCPCGDVVVKKRGKYRCQGCGEIYTRPPGKT